MIEVQEVIRTSPKELMLLQGVQEMRFDDGVIFKFSPARLALQRLYLSMHEKYLNRNVRVTLNSDLYVGKKPYHTNAHLKILANNFWSLWKDISDQGLGNTDEFWALSKYAYEATNEIYNFSHVELQRYVISADITDYSYVKDPRIMKAKENIQTAEDVAHVYDVTLDVIKNQYEGHEHSVLRKGVISGIQSTRSVSQGVGCRGFTQDIDSSAFIYPITKGYIERLDTAYDSMIEAPSARKAYLSQSRPLEESETFSRVTQLAMGVILEMGEDDCGSQHYLKWFAEEWNFNLILGKNFLDEELNIVREIVPSDKEKLCGKTIKIRSTTMCASKDRSRPCKTCLGKYLSTVIPPFYALGQTLAYSINAQISQYNMSIKHFDASVKLNHFTNLTGGTRYFYPNKDKPWLLMVNQKRPARIGLKLRLPRRAAKNINLVFGEDSVRTLAISTVSSVREVELITYEKDKEGNEIRKSSVIVDVMDNKFPSHLTHDFLQHVRDNRYTEINNDVEDKVIDEMFLNNPEHFKERYRDLDEEVMYNDNLEPMTLPEKVKKMYPINDYIEVDISKFSAHSPIISSARKIRGFESIFHDAKRYLEGSDKETNAKIKEPLVVHCTGVEEAIADLMDVFYPAATEENPNPTRLNVSLGELEMWIKACMAKDVSNLDYRLPRAGEDFDFITFINGVKNRSISSLLPYQNQDRELNKSTIFKVRRSEHVLDKLVYPDPN